MKIITELLYRSQGWSLPVTAQEEREFSSKEELEKFLSNNPHLESFNSRYEDGSPVYQTSEEVYRQHFAEGLIPGQTAPGKW